MNPYSKPPQPTRTPNWLRRVQEQSWEPETLISGIVLVGLLQAPDLLNSLSLYLDTQSFYMFGRVNVDNTLVMILKVANFWLILGFATHLFFRSVWVAFVGMSFVYKQGIDNGELTYRQPFKEKLERQKSYTNQIIRLEKLCSSIFAISFLFFMSFLGAFMFLTVCGGLIFSLFFFFPEFDQYQLIDISISLVGGIYLFDFVTLGLLKRIPYFSKVYYPFYQVMSLLTLAPLYRSIYYGFVTNHRKWKVMALMIAFVAISIFGVTQLRSEGSIFSGYALNVENDDFLLFKGHYENLYGDKPSYRIHIPSDLIESNTLRIFVVHSTAYEKDHIQKLCDYDSLTSNSAEDIPEDSLKITCMQKFYEISLDDEPLSTPSFYHTNPRTGQDGLVGWYDISELDNGLHVLRLYYRFVADDGTINRQKVAAVEFYKSVYPAIGGGASKIMGE